MLYSKQLKLYLHAHNYYLFFIHISSQIGLIFKRKITILDFFIEETGQEMP